MAAAGTVKLSTAEHSAVVAEYKKQAQRLGLEEDNDNGDKVVDAKWVTPQDPVLATVNAGRLPAVPVDEAVKLNRLKNQAEGRAPTSDQPRGGGPREAKDGTLHGLLPPVSPSPSFGSQAPDAPLRDAIPPAKTNPLFPPLPMYGPPTFLRTVQCLFFRFSASILSFYFLMAIVLGAAFTSIPMGFTHILIQLKGSNPDARRPFYEEEERRRKRRREEEAAWTKRQRRRSRSGASDEAHEEVSDDKEEYVPMEGGPDPLVSDIRYYARRVGLDAEEFKVHTEDGFCIQLWHLYNPREYQAASEDRRRARSCEPFSNSKPVGEDRTGNAYCQFEDGRRRYPVLMMHGLLQSAGAYCCTEDKSLAFFLAKAGYDVWLGNNRCGFEPEHSLLTYGDPRMWAWNIRQMGVMDLPAFISRVLEETGFEQLGLVCHSQGTTQTLVALAKEQRPEIGEKISVFCALAPAAYAGPLIRKMYFKFMQVISPAMFRLLFGIHAFIPFMMKMHKLLPGRLYGAMGYRVFAFLFDWTDTRWEQDLRNRMFQFSPVFVSSESMRWWLGRECFAKQKCILSTRDEGQLEDEEDEEEDDYFTHHSESGDPAELSCKCDGHCHKDHGRYAWYDKRAPPMAFWVAGNDKLVDGRRLLRRFERGREPNVDVVHAKVIDEYEHLDVIWALDSIDQVGSEVKDIIWKTAPKSARAVCRVPVGCETVPFYSSYTHSNSDVAVIR